MVFAGERRDLPRIYAAADAFILPTSYETFSLVCMEAMSCAVPVFATPAGGIEDYLVDGVNGYRIPQDASAIAAIIAPVLADDAKLAALSEGARSTALRFSWEAVAAQYTVLLQEIWQRKTALAH